MPNKKLVAIKEVRLHIQPIAAVQMLHHVTIRRSTLRGPSQSPIHPPGISNSA